MTRRLFSVHGVRLWSYRSVRTIARAGGQLRLKCLYKHMPEAESPRRCRASLQLELRNNTGRAQEKRAVQVIRR